MDRSSRQALEAILFVVDEPVAVSTLSEILAASESEIEASLAALATELVEERRGFVLRRVAGGWRLYTAPETAPYVERWVRGRRSGRLSRAALETLAVIAYKQPISRAEVAEIRGVNADGAMRTLVARGLIGEVGRDVGPGQAVLYGTTARFLEDVGINSLSDLPPLADFLPPGPAPDEPSPEQQRDARALIRAGRVLPSSGKARWEPEPNLPASELTPPDDPLGLADRRGTPAAADDFAVSAVQQHTAAPPCTARGLESAHPTGPAAGPGQTCGGSLPILSRSSASKDPLPPKDPLPLQDALPPDGPHPSTAPGDRDEELDALTEALERATRNALSVLENALQATDENTSRVAGDAAGPALPQDARDGAEGAGGASCPTDGVEGAGGMDRDRTEGRRLDGGRDG